MIVDLNHYKTAVAMMTVSHYHQDYSDQDIKDFIEPPLSLGNYLIIQDEYGLPYVLRLGRSLRCTTLTSMCALTSFQRQHFVVVVTAHGSWTL